MGEDDASQERVAALNRGVRRSTIMGIAFATCSFVFFIVAARNAHTGCTCDTSVNVGLLIATLFSFFAASFFLGRAYFYFIERETARDTNEMTFWER